LPVRPSPRAAPKRTNDWSKRTRVTPDRSAIHAAGWLAIAATTFHFGSRVAGSAHERNFRWRFGSNGADGLDPYWGAGACARALPGAGVLTAFANAGTACACGGACFGNRTATAARERAEERRHQKRWDRLHPGNLTRPC